MAFSNLGSSAPTPKKPAPAKPTPAFSKPAAQKPFAPQQRAAAKKTATARAKLPTAPIAAPPVIANPTPTQVKDAKAQIVSSVRAAVGTSGTPEQRQQRRDQLLHDVRTKPQYRDVKASLDHWNSESAKLDTPQSKLTNQLDRVAPGRKPSKVKVGVGPLELGTVNVTAATQGLAHTIDAAAPGLSTGAARTLSASASHGLLHNAASDVATLGKGPFVGGYEALHAIVHDTLAGPHQDARDSESAKLGKAILGGYVKEAEHPVRSFKQHPVLTALDAAGALSLLGRTGGAFARGAGAKDAAGVRGALDRHSHTVRPPIAMVDDAGQPALRQRTFSKDLTRRAAQVKADARREPVRDANGKPITVVDRGREVPVLKATDSERERLLKKRGDFIASRANSGERPARDEAGRDVKIKGVKGKRAKAVVAMAVEGTLTSAAHFADDLRSARDRRAAEVAKPDQYRHTGDLDIAKAKLGAMNDILADPKTMRQGPKIVAEAERLGAHLNEADKANVAAGLGSEQALRRSGLIVPAIEHMGARHFTVEEHQQLERDARVHEKVAADKYAAAKTPTARKAATAELHAAREARIAVSGRDPDAVRAHEDAQATHAHAQQMLRDAKASEEGAQRRVQALAAQHKSERAREGHNTQIAAYYVGPHRFDLRGDAIAFAKLKGVKLTDIRRVATTPGEAKRVGELSQARRALKAATSRRRAATKRIALTAREVDTHKLPETKAGIRYGETSAAKGFAQPAGAHLPNEHIEDFLRSRGRNPDTVAYLPHRQGVIGNRAHHTQFRPGTRPVLDAGETRTGEAYRRGVTESSERLIHDQGVRQAVQLNKAKAIDQLVADHGLRHPAWSKAQRGLPLTKGEQRIVDKGGLFTGPEALEVADRIGHDADGQRLTPMRAYQGALDADTKRIIRENFQGPGGMETLSQRLLNNRVVTPDETIDTRTRNVVLVPSTLVERLEAHLRPAGDVEKFFQYLNRPFRMAVLPQFRWLAGNFVQSQIVRLGVKGSGLVNIPGLAVDLAATKRALAVLDKGTPEMREAAAQIRGQQTGSGLFIGNKGAGVRRTLGETLPEGVARQYGKVVAHLPVVAQMAEMLQTATHWISAPARLFFEINRIGIENPAQRAAFGHQFRADIQAMTGSWIKSVALGHQAVADAAKGLVNTPAQQRFMESQYELLGKYSGQSPTMRAFTQSVAPFLPWALNAARFVYWTMPGHHTVKTSLLLKTQQVTQQSWDEIHKDTPPGDLRDAIPNGNGGWIDLARYTDYGLTDPIANGENLQSLTSFFTPQIGGAENALQGKDPFGNDLKVSNRATPTQGQDVKIAINQMLESVVPYLAMTRRLQEHGETSFADSTAISPKTKPGTSHGMSAAERSLSPIRPTYLGGSAPAATPEPTQAPVAEATPAQSPADALRDRMRGAMSAHRAASGSDDLAARIRAAHRRP